MIENDCMCVYQNYYLFIALPPAVQRGLEEMSEDLNSMNPAFTIRRQLQQAQEEMELCDQLRRVSQAFCWSQWVEE